MDGLVGADRGRDRCRCARAHRADAIAREIERIVTGLAPTSLALVGLGPLTAAKIVGETADVAGSVLQPCSLVTTGPLGRRCGPGTVSDTDFPEPVTGSRRRDRPHRGDPDALSR